MSPRPVAHDALDAAAEYLRQLGERVRRLRAQRGMSRRVLAEASGVSERYLAQLESGAGNASILILKAIGDAMHIALDDLVDPRAGQAPDYLLLRERLREAGPAELERIAAAMRGQPRAAAERERHIALIGLRGAGKSTLGAALAKRIGVPFVELSQEIERAAGAATGEIFARGGQEAYRRLEQQALATTLGRYAHAVIATGGSLVSEPQTFDLLKRGCYTVWLKASPREHMERVVAQGDLRPMASHRDAMADLKRMLAERGPLYGQADATIDTSGRDVKNALQALLALAPVQLLGAANGERST